MIKLLVSDLDGTLLNHENNIQQEDIDAIQQATRQGIGFAIATGRMDHEIQSVLDILHQTGNGHRVSQNGAFVYDKDGKFIHANTFPHEHIQDIFAATISEKTLTSVSTETDTYVLEENWATREMQKRIFHTLLIEPALKEQLGKSIHPSKISVHGKTEDLQSLQQILDERFADHLDSFISDPSCLDLMPKNICKGAAVEQLMSILKIEPDEMACFGDSFNDVSMFELTKHSYAMAQAPDQVKARTEHVVPNVAEAITDLRSKGLL
ncbi:HAD family hydrolase [Pontibacillus salicampi]|uniref:HAD family hydrolase n=1 Tax=Pontibacillus salicampi TaxID=1449801 RepID=A0ABV6LHX9_9BACI